MKKAQGLTLNTMALAVIVLVVIVVTIAIFTGVIGSNVIPFFESRGECINQPNSLGCKETVKDCDDVGGVDLRGVGCPDSTPYCCIKN